MPAEFATAYFDANVILAFVSEEEHRAIVVRELLRQGDQGHRRIYTSTLSIAEVAFGAQEKVARALDHETEARIDSVWQASGKPVTLVEASITTMRLARTLIRDAMVAGNRLTAADAVHLATAQAMKVATFYTYEDEARRAAWSALTGLDVAEPSVEQEPML